MGAYSACGIIHMALQIQDFHSNYHTDTGNDAGDRGAQGVHRVSARASGCRAVKAVPAQPENENAQSAQCNGMAGNGRNLRFAGFGIPGVLAQGRPQKRRTHQGAEAANHMDGGGAGKIMKAPGEKPALGVPDPVGLDGVNDQADKKLFR